MGEMIQQWDFQILDWIQANLRSPWLDWLVPKISFLCNGGWFWILIMIILLLRKKQRRWGMTMAIALALCVLFGNLLLKHLVARPRPCWINPDVSMLIEIPKDYSFPSGHSMVSFASATALLLYEKRIGIPAIVLAAMIALSRMYLYVHFPTDVITGTLMGILFGILAVWLAGKLKAPRSIPEQSAETDETAPADPKSVKDNHQ